MSRRRGCIRSSCCPRSSCVRHLASRIARYKISITSDVSSNGLREGPLAPVASICLSLLAFFSAVFPSFRLPVRLGQSKKKNVFFQVSRTMWKLALHEWKLHSSLVPPSCPLEMSPMFFNHSFFETQRRKNTKVESSDSGCQHLRLLPKNRRQDISCQVRERTLLTYAFAS